MEAFSGPLFALVSVVNQGLMSARLTVLLQPGKTAGTGFAIGHWVQRIQAARFCADGRLICEGMTPCTRRKACENLSARL